MSKKAVLFHGADGRPTDHWFPWFQKILESKGYAVFAPELPDSNTPDRERYDAFLRAADWDHTGNILIGHSSGSTTILNLLMESWFPPVKAIVLVGLFLNERLVTSADWYVSGQFDRLFPPGGFDVDAIRRKVGRIYVVHSVNDPYCAYDDAKAFVEQIGATLVTVPHGHHLGSASGLKSLPEIVKVMQKDTIL